ncbi:MAG: hypothetical protein ACKVQC_09720 [Elusimicrobiota bacterium]
MFKVFGPSMKRVLSFGFLRKTGLLLCTLFSLVSPSYSAFQELLWGARPAALGGAYTAYAEDSNAPVYNPSGIALLSQTELTFMYAQLFTGLNLYSGEDTSRLGLGYFSYAPNIKNKKFGSYAFSWTNFSASTLYREDAFSLTAADSYQFESLPSKPVLSYGANLKYLKRSFATNQRSDVDPVFRGGRDSGAFAIDLGLMIHPHFENLPGLKFGFAGKNINEPDMGLQTTDRVPARYAIGVSYHDPALPLLNPMLDISRRKGQTVVSAGWEAWMVKDILALRFGGNKDQLGGGMGYVIPIAKNKMSLKFDYAILWPLNVDGSNGSHRVSITTAF